MKSISTLMYMVWHVDKYKITFKLLIPGESLAARYNWCQGPVPGHVPAAEKHWSRQKNEVLPKQNARF